jgi:hypothetical protein
MLAVVLLALPVAVARQEALLHIHSKSLSTSHAHGFLKKDDACECSYHGTCSCQGALEFMTCIKHSCESDDCRCVVNDRKHFKEACQNMAAECPDLGLNCADEEATCGQEAIAWSPTDAVVQHHDDEDDSEDSDEESQDSAPAKVKLWEKRPVSGLPDGWEQDWSDSENRAYYYNRETGESSWTPPPTAANGYETPELPDLSGILQAATTPAPRQSSPATTLVPEMDTVNVAGQTYVSMQYYNYTMNTLKRKEHHSMAQGTIATIAGMAIVVALMVSSSSTAVKNTWATVNSTICVFLALLWYYVCVDAFYHHEIEGWAKCFVHTCIALLLLLASSVLTWAIEKKTGDKDATTFNSIYDHILVWSFCGIANEAQMQFHSPGYVFLATCGLVIFFSIIAIVWHKVVGKFTTHFGSAHSIDFLSGAALASAVVDLIHLLLTGVWHQVGYHDPVHKTPLQKGLMFFASFAWILVALKAAPLIKTLNDACLDDKGDALPGMYWKMRAIATLGIFATWIPHFSVVLNLGNTIISTFGWAPDSVEAHLYVTIVSCAIGVFIIALCTKVKILRDNKTFSNILVGLSGFMIGTSLAGALNNSISMALEGNSQHFAWRCAIATFLTLVVFPVYYFDFKPLLDKKMAAT